MPFLPGTEQFVLDQMTAVESGLTGQGNAGVDFWNDMGDYGEVPYGGMAGAWDAAQAEAELRARGYGGIMLTGAPMIGPGGSTKLLTAGAGAAAAAASPAVASTLAKIFPWLLAAGGAALDYFTPGGILNQPEVIPGSTVPLGGPGLAEPPSYMVVKQWNANGAQFYRLLDGRIAVYSKKRGTWKLYRPAKNIVISRNPRVKNLLSISGKIDRMMRAFARKSPVLKYGRTARRSKR